MKKTLPSALLILGVIFLFALNSHADSWTEDLSGEYRVTGTQTCVILGHGQWNDKTSSGQETSFGSELELPESCLPPGQGAGGYACILRTGQISGRLRLDQDGTGTLSYYFAQWTPQNLVGGNRPYQLKQAGDMGGAEVFDECQVEYGINPSGTTEGYLKILEGCMETITRGKGGANPQLESSEINLRMDRSKDGKILILLNSLPHIETNWRFGEKDDTISERLCTRQFTAVRTSK